jgi:hypothetical protein
MINVETIDLTRRGITLPSDRVGMVIAQPYVELTANEPFQCEPAATARQMAVLRETLAVARAAPHGAAKTHFTVFPEYSIPGLGGVALIDATLSHANWPAGTIVIGGTDALSKLDFATLAGARNTYWDSEHNSLARIAANEWINCGITWVKAADGTVERWLQPKLSRAWPEQNVPCRDMFLGKSVFTFKGPLENGFYYRFSTLVCFDWVATVDGKKAWRWVVDDLQQQAEQVQAELSVSWLFIIQRNPKPSHDTFLSEVGSFFDQNTVPNVHRNDACLVFANNAGLSRPGRAAEFGSTSLIFSPQAQFAKPDCRPTFCSGGERFRSSTLLNPYHDVLFRERGACIHSFVQENPRSVTVGAAGRTFPIDRPFVFPLNGAVEPRAPATLGPACIKWLNDELDALDSLSSQYPASALAGHADAAHRQTITGLRAVPDRSAVHTVKLAAKESKAKCADEWGRTEAEALEHLVHTVDIIGIGFPNPVVGADPAHATAVINCQVVDLLAIRGNTHEGCIDHAKTFSLLPRRQVLLVSRDRDNTPWPKMHGSFLERETPQLGQERRITDPQAATLHLGYEKLLNIFLNSPTPATLQGMINAELVA